jgi:hypothetical protein
MTTAERVESLRQRFNGPMSDDEVELLRDFQGLIDFAIRNGLSFTLVLSILSHDIQGIAQGGWSLEAAKKSAFSPKAAGWSKINADDVGEPDESQ